MKQLIKILLIACLIVGYGCSDYLDITPSGMKDETTIWTSENEVKKYMASMYSGIPVHKFYQDDPWVGCADECDLSWTVYTTYPMNQGNWKEGQDYFNKYNLFYSAIRQSFVLEKNIDRCKEMSTSDRERAKYEAKFIRGYMYWMLLRQYGPVVLVKEGLNYDDDFTSFMRAPYDESVDYICQMMDEAEAGLPADWSADQQQLGRPNKTVCKAVKAVVLHHAASPQFNGNIEYANFKNPDGTELINTTYDENKWRKAAAAAKAVIDIAEANPSILGLYTGGISPTDPNYNAYKTLVEIPLVKWNKEVIFGRSRGEGLTGWMVHTNPGPACLGGVGPTQRLVDAFLMNNGKTIDSHGSNYVENGWATTGGDYWNPSNANVTTEAGRKKIITDLRNMEAWGHWPGDWNMYANREPRFYASIMYNKRVIAPLPPDDGRRNFYNTAGQQDGLGKVELYLGGKSRQSGSYTFYPRTGYLSFKYVDPLSETGVGAERKWPRKYAEIYIRYATILLNYIECLNEYDPGHADIRKYWDMIRVRAGVPSAFDTNPEIAGNQVLQRDFIIRERQIELNMEGDRYFTTRRRWIAHKTDTESRPGYERFGDGGPQYGMDINAGDATTNSFSTTEFYQRSAFETRVFRKAFYLFPLPKKEVDNGEGKIVQNPWWRE